MSAGIPCEGTGGVAGEPTGEFVLRASKFVSGDCDNAGVGVGVGREGSSIVGTRLSTGPVTGESDRHNVHS